MFVVLVAIASYVFCPCVLWWVLCGLCLSRCLLFFFCWVFVLCPVSCALCVVLCCSTHFPNRIIEAAALRSKRKHQDFVCCALCWVMRVVSIEWCLSYVLCVSKCLELCFAWFFMFVSWFVLRQGAFYCHKVQIEITGFLNAASISVAERRDITPNNPLSEWGVKRLNFCALYCVYCVYCVLCVVRWVLSFAYDAFFVANERAEVENENTAQFTS